MIDDLKTGAQALVVGAGTPSATSTVAASGALGGSRTLTTTLMSSDGRADACVIPVGLAIAGAGAGSSMHLTMEWNGSGAGLGDLTDGGTADSIVVAFFDVDPGMTDTEMMFSFHFTSTTAETATISKMVPAGHYSMDTPMSMRFAFSDALLSPGAGSQPFESVQSLRMEVTLNNAADFAIHSIRTDPERIPGPKPPPERVPDGGSTGALMAAVLGAFGLLRKLGSRTGAACSA